MRIHCSFYQYFIYSGLCGSNIPYKKLCKYIRIELQIQFIYINDLTTISVFISVVYILAHIQRSFCCCISLLWACSKVSHTCTTTQHFQESLLTFPPLLECVEVNVRVHLNSDIKVIVWGSSSLKVRVLCNGTPGLRSSCWCWIFSAWVCPWSVAFVLWTYSAKHGTRKMQLDIFVLRNVTHYSAIVRVLNVKYVNCKKSWMTWR